MTRTPSRPTTPRRSLMLAIPVIVASAVAVSACSPITTDIAYSPSDGIRVDLTDNVRALNLLIVSAAEGEPGTLLGAAANDSDEALEITIAPDGTDPVDVPLEAGETVYFSVDNGFEAQFGNVDAAPGATIPVTVSASTGETETVEVPVVNGALEEYKDYLP
ncbi:hypothetical protein [Oerskovia turbata]